EIRFCENSLNAFAVGEEREFYISQSFSMYEGAVFYGFLSSEHRDIFELFRKAVPNTGAKKALDYLNKTLKSPGDFKRAVLKNDVKQLTGIFGFTAKTAEKIIAALKDRISEIKTELSGDEGSPSYESGRYADAMNALVSLGYKPAAARDTVSGIISELKGEDRSPEEIIKMALRKLSR
ncbi:MAG: hypothetical protein COT17_05870, partial [Elusimicrobia bacterium CG08_land_8_20_14_0_20_51_18]